MSISPKLHPLSRSNNKQRLLSYASHLEIRRCGVVGWGRQPAAGGGAVVGCGEEEAPRSPRSKKRRARSGEAAGRSEEAGIWSADLYARVGSSLRRETRELAAPRVKMRGREGGRRARVIFTLLTGENNKSIISRYFWQFGSFVLEF